MPRVHAAGTLSQTPQAGRVETDDHHTAFRHQHPLHFAQRLVRVTRQFQCMRQHHQVDAGVGKGQRVKLAVQADRLGWWQRD
jgi:hypothetical protein